MTTGAPVDDAFLRALPKVELHCHLEGSVPAATFLDLSARHGVKLPTRDPDHVYDFTSFLAFLDLYYLVCESVRDAADFERAAYDSLAHGVRTGNLRYREMFFSPTNHHHVDYPTMVAGLVAGIEAAEADFGVRCRMIADINRRQSPHVAVELVEAVLAHSSPYVIGIGMDDDEDSGPPERFVEAYRVATRGLKRTAHAGELGSSANVRTSLELLGCDRIDHGYAMVRDADVMQRVRDAGVHVTGAWFVNNFHAGVFTAGTETAAVKIACRASKRRWVSVRGMIPPLVRAVLQSVLNSMVQNRWKISIMAAPSRAPPSARRWSTPFTTASDAVRAAWVASRSRWAPSVSASDSQRRTSRRKSSNETCVPCSSSTGTTSPIWLPHRGLAAARAISSACSTPSTPSRAGRRRQALCRGGGPDARGVRTRRARRVHVHASIHPRCDGHRCGAACAGRPHRRPRPSRPATPAASLRACESGRRARRHSTLAPPRPARRTSGQRTEGV